MDKRKNARVEFLSTANLLHGGLRVSGSIRDLSMKGLFVVTAATLPVNAPVDVEITLSGSTTELSILIKGTVVRCEKEGIAVTFSEMELDSFIHLRNIVFYADEELQEYYEFL